MKYRIRLQGRSYDFKNLKTLMAKATPARSGDALAGIAAETQLERVAAQWVLAEVPLQQFLSEADRLGFSGVRLKPRGRVSDPDALPSEG